VNKIVIFFLFNNFCRKKDLKYTWIISWKAIIWSFGNKNMKSMIATSMKLTTKKHIFNCSQIFILSLILLKFW